MQHKTRGVRAYTFGSRTDASCRELPALLNSFNIGMQTTYEWGGYAREVQKEKHLAGEILHSTYCAQQSDTEKSN
jgi:insertion element IS1 protein InsB